MGTMTLVHVSLTEYLIVFGSDIGSEGHTGRFLVDDFFMVLEGEQWTQRANETRKSVYGAGTINKLPKGEAFQYAMPGHCYGLEYARGWIFTMMPFGLISTLTSTLDFFTLFKTLWVFTKLVTWNLLTGKI